MPKTKTVLRKTYKSKVVLTPENEKELREISVIMVLLWNLAHAQILEWWNANQGRTKEDRKVINAFALNYWLTPIRASHPDINAVSSDLCQQILKIIMGGFESFWALHRKNDSSARIPKIKGSEEKPFTGFMTLAWQKLNCTETHISVLTRNKQRMELALPPYLQKQIVGKQVSFAKLYYKEGHFWLSLVCTSELPQVSEKPKFIRAIDLGAGDIAVSDSDGSDFLVSSRRPDKKTRQSIRHIEARMRIRIKGSRGYQRLLESRKKLWNHTSSQNKDFQRKIADALCEKKVEAIVIGKSCTRLGLAQSKNSVSDEHFGSQNTGYMFRLLLFIREKCQERGILFIEKSDPKRVGDKNEAESKFNASQSILTEACSEFEVSMNTVRTRKKFQFNAGKKRLCPV